MAEPRKNMSKLLALMDHDIKSIEKDLVPLGKLPTETVLDITRWAKMLMDIVEDDDSEKERAKDKWSKYSHAELKEMAIKALNKKGNEIK